jgi:DNA repair protein RecO (recombination protein O)
MEWREEGIVIASRKYGETSAIAEILTKDRGRCLGLVRGGRSRRQRPVLQPGNIVEATWRARLEEHLGTFGIEPMGLRAGSYLDDAFKLAGLMTLTFLAQLLPEREPHPRIYQATRLFLDALDDDSVWPALLVRWELGLLDELGFGLDLIRCTVTGTTDDLAYVSPKTGRAVSRTAGAAYKERLFLIPDFLKGSQMGDATPEAIIGGLRLTGHFLDRHIFEPRSVRMPDCREWIMSHLKRSIAR